MPFKPNNIVKVDENTLGIECFANKTKEPILFLIDAEDYPRIKMFRWSIDTHGYAVSKVFTKTASIFRVKLHRLIMSFPDGYFIDHKNLDKTNNKKENLRLTNPQGNSANRTHQVNNKLKIKGVTFRKDRNKYRATINTGRKQIFLGHYNTAEEAKLAYDLKAKELFGEFSRG